MRAKSWKHREASVNGVKLHYVTAGRGKLVLFLHGFPEFWYAWRAQLEELGRDHHAVAVDLRGYNLSSKPAEVEQYRLPHLVEDVRALAAHLKAKRLVLVGHDWGGVIAWVFAMQHPKLVEKLVIINAPHPLIFQRELQENTAQQQASQYMNFFRSAGAETAISANNYAAFVEGILGEGLKKGYFTEEDRTAYIAAWSQPGALTGGLNYYRAAAVGPPVPAADPAASPGGEATAKEPGPVAGEELRRLPAGGNVTVPTLVIWGEQDQALLVGNLNGLERYVSDLTVRRIPDGSHWVVHEHPDRVNTLIREFLRAKRRK
jgi:pimeloyl-ACP methyl ester carboxylesterase